MYYVRDKEFVEDLKKRSNSFWKSTFSRAMSQTTSVSCRTL